MTVKRHGYIRALNLDNGVEYEIRPDMLKRTDHHWRVLDKEYLHLPGAMLNQDRRLPTEASKADVKKSNKVEETVIMTSKGKPFATENAAKSVMARKGLSEDQWIILPNGKDGFIISKV